MTTLLEILGFKKEWWEKPFLAVIPTNDWKFCFCDGDTFRRTYRERESAAYRTECRGFCDRQRREIWILYTPLQNDLMRLIGHEVIHSILPRAKHSQWNDWLNLEDEIKKAISG